MFLTKSSSIVQIMYILCILKTEFRVNYHLYVKQINFTKINIYTHIYIIYIRDAISKHENLMN